jgi:glycosyltransferase involved in cell wall biosynthesis
MGLSVARNVGMKAGRGEIIAYTDSDCMADKDWLYYLIGTIEKGDFVSVGGPNISPPAQSWAQACVAVSPGQPSHVLISDSEAEHIPGCNMAFYKWALESIGGFDPEYRKAGDDVDVCWRLMEQGYKIGFSPSAIVWHHRRFTTRAYFKQQAGYGEAEALLRFKHFVYFGPTGSAKWRGCVYGPTHFSSLLQRPIVYHGVFGMGLFQCIYPKQTSDFVLLMGSLEWNTLTLITLAIALQVHSAWYVPAILFLCTVVVSLSYGFRARVEPPYQGFRSHLLVSLLAFLQPMERGWARYSTWMQKKRTPGNVLHPTAEGKAVKIIWDRHALLSFWSEESKGREQFLSAFEARLDQEGWRFSADTGWTNWDYQVYGNSWWQTRLLTVTEEHGDGKRLTRVRLHPNPTTLSRFIAFVMGVISLLAFIKFWNRLETEAKTFNYIGIWFSFVSLWLMFLVWRSSTLRRRVAQIVELAAKDCKFTPIQSKTSKTK